MNTQSLRPNLKWYHYGIIVSVPFIGGLPDSDAAMAGVFTASFLFVWFVVAAFRTIQDGTPWLRGRLSWGDIGRRYQAWKTDSVANDDRANIGIARLLLSGVIGSIVLWVVWSVSEPLYTYTSEQSSDTVATTGTSYLQQFGDFIPIFFLFVMFFGTIAGAVFTREVLS